MSSSCLFVTVQRLPVLGAQVIGAKRNQSVAVRDVNVTVAQTIQVEIPRVHKGHGGDGKLTVLQGIQEIVKGRCIGRAD